MGYGGGGTPVKYQRLATLGVDAVDLTLYAGGRYAVIQRDPQPDEAGIPRATGLHLRIVDLEGDPAAGGGPGWAYLPWGIFPFGTALPPPWIPPAGGIGLRVDWEVYVDGVLAVSCLAGYITWGAAWAGTVTVADVYAPYFYYQIDAVQVAPPLFASEQVVPVRVVVDPTSPLLDLTYTFTVEDVTPPTLLTAVARDAWTVRLTYDEAMALDGAGSALLPAAYTILRHNVDPVPAVALLVTAVAEVPGSGATQFDLTTQWEATPGCAYEVVVDAAVTDAAGNAIQ